MAYQEFQKIVVSPGTILTGTEKAAILMGELGPNIGMGVMQYLSTKEIKKLRKAMKNLSPQLNITNEVNVLAAVNRYGVMHHLTMPVDLSPEHYSPELQLRNSVLQNIHESKPDTVAGVLSSWLSSEDE